MLRRAAVGDAVVVRRNDVRPIADLDYGLVERFWSIELVANARDGSGALAQCSSHLVDDRANGTSVITFRGENARGRLEDLLIADVARRPFVGSDADVFEQESAEQEVRFRPDFTFDLSVLALADARLGAHRCLSDPSECAEWRQPMFSIWPLK